MTTLHFSRYTNLHGDRRCIMNKPEQNSKPELVACELCMKEIPKADASVIETHDYVVHFCGLDCYDQWRKQGSTIADKDTTGQ